MPVYTRIFSPEEYGILEIFNTVLMMLTLVAVLGFDSALGLFFYQVHEEKEQKRLFSTAIFVSVALAVVLSIIVLMNTNAILDIFSLGKDYLAAIKVIALLLPFSVYFIFVTVLLRLHKAPVKYAILTLGSSIITALLSLVMVIQYRSGITGILIATLASNIVFSSIGYILTRSNYSLSFDVTSAKKMLKIGVPLIPASFAYWTIAYSDRYFLIYYKSLETLGLYAVGAKIASIVFLITSGFQLAWGPFAYSIQKEDDAKETYASVMNYYLLVLGIIVCILALSSRFIVSLLTPDAYVSSYKLVGILAFGIMIYGMFYIVSIGVNLAEKTKYVAWAAVTGAIVNILFNAMLIPSFGTMGAAIATTLAYASATILLYVFSQANYPIPYQAKKTAIGLIMVLAVVVLAIDPGTLPVLGAKGLAILLTVVFTIYVIRGNGPKDQEYQKVDNLNIELLDKDLS